MRWGEKKKGRIYISSKRSERRSGPCGMAVDYKSGGMGFRRREDRIWYHIRKQVTEDG